jgi:HPt (histidine-containing phosphotransfer) domain-containing protein
MSEGIDSALAEVWRHSAPLLEERLTAIELGIDELSPGCAEPTLAGGGHAQAHMLAGVLGTFGLDRGTVLARDLEEHLGHPQAGSEVDRLTRVAAQLRAVVDGATYA